MSGAAASCGVGRGSRRSAWGNGGNRGLRTQQAAWACLRARMPGTFPLSACGWSVGVPLVGAVA